MLLSKETQEILGLTEPTYLEFHHRYADVWSVADLVSKKTDDPKETYDPKAGKNTVTRKPIGTVVSIVQGELKDKAKLKVIDAAESKCHPKDQFSREKGRKYAMNKLLNRKDAKDQFVYSKAKRTAIWKDYFGRNEATAVPATTN